MPDPIRKCLIVACLCASVSPGAALARQNRPIELFLPVDAELQKQLERAQGTLPDTSVRVRYASVNPDYLQAVVLPSGAKGRPAAVIQLRLFPDVVLEAVTLDVEKDEEGAHIWTAWVKSKQYGRLSLAFGGSVLSGTVHVDNRVFEILPVRERIVSIAEINQGRFPPEGRPLVPKTASDSSSATLRVLVILPRPEYGFFCDSNFLGLDWTKLLASSFKSNLNGVFKAVRDSGVRAKVVVACTRYSPEGGDLQDDLAWVRANSTVAALRDEHKADLVSLIVPSASVCGRGYYNFPVTSASEDWAFSVVKFSCATSNYSLAHEIGHNIGMQHDRVVEGLEGSNACNFGSIFDNPPGRSVMSYGSSCGNCTRYGLYSTPLRWSFEILGMQISLGPFGVGCSAPASGGNYERANNRQQLIDAAATVAAFR